MSIECYLMEVKSRNMSHAVLKIAKLLFLACPIYVNQQKSSWSVNSKLAFKMISIQISDNHTIVQVVPQVVNDVILTLYWRQEVKITIFMTNFSIFFANLAINWSYKQRKIVKIIISTQLYCFFSIQIAINSKNKLCMLS